jgi:hypothetical protein
MLEGLRQTLKRLRSSLSRRTEQAYEDRDAANNPLEAAFAEGEAHAFTIAEDEVREAQEEGQASDETTRP